MSKNEGGLIDKKTVPSGDVASLYVASGFDLVDLFTLLYEKKILILIFSGLFMVGGLVYITNSEPYYHSSIVFTSPPESLMSGQTGGQDLLGGVGSLIGVGGKTSPATAFTLSILESRDFAATFFKKHDVMPILVPKYWDEKSSKWKPVESSALGKVKNFFLGEEPLFIKDNEEIIAELAYKEFNDIMSIDINKDTQIITLNIDWKNPIEASKWANQLLNLLNETMRERTISQSNKRVTYLQVEIEKSKVASVKKILSFLLENELKTKMVANVQEDFSFTIIDQAYPASRPFRPRKIVILVLCLIGGFLMGSLYFMSTVYIQRLKATKL